MLIFLPIICFFSFSIILISFLLYKLIILHEIKSSLIAANEYIIIDNTTISSLTITSDLKSCISCSSDIHSLTNISPGHYSKLEVSVDVFGCVKLNNFLAEGYIKNYLIFNIFFSYYFLRLFSFTICFVIS